MKARFVRTLALLFLSAVWVSSPAWAQSEDDERGRAHFLAGSSYYKTGDYEAAAREFQEAFDLSGRPEMLLNLSASHHKAGNLESAISALELLLSRYPKTSRRPEAEERLAALKKEREEKQAEAATAPGPEAEAKAPPANETLPPRETAPVTPPSQEPASGPRVGLATWIVGGAAVVLGGVAIGTGVIAHGRYTECEDGTCSQSEIDDGKTMALVSTVTSFAALGAAGAAVTMFLLDVGVHEEKSQVALSPVWSKDGAGLSLHTRF